MTLPTDSKARKHLPVATGVLDYFPDAIAAIAQISWDGNEKHNPGEPLHWAREKSADHPDCLIRHFLERGTLDDDGGRHSAKVAWRALAILQLEIEAERAAEKADEPEWIPWTGGKEPLVNPLWEVEVKFRYGGTSIRYAGYWDWGRWGDGSTEIIAYRVVKSTP